MSDLFHVPTHMFPLIMKQTPPNIFFSENPLRCESMGRIRPANASSFLISVLPYLSQGFLEFGDEFPDLVDRHQVEQNRQHVLPVVGRDHTVVLQPLGSVT